MWMKKLVTLAKDPLIKVSSRITSFLEPEYIYLPIDEEIRQNIDYKKVKKGDLLYSWQGKKQYSPVSGKIVGFLQNSQGLFLKIQNDYREEDSYNGVKEFTTMSIRTNFQSQIKNFPDFDWSKFKNQKTLILNGIEDEPYAATRTFLNKLKSQEILEMLDLLRETFQMNEVLLYLKENDRESIEAFSKYLGTYPKISIQILPDYYPIGHEVILKSYLHLPEDSILLRPEEVYELYLNTIRDRKRDTILLTITGNAIENPQVFEVKIGTSLKEILKEHIHFKTAEYNFYINGLMHRETADVKEVILTPEIRVLYFMNPLHYKTKPCVHCGKCNEICPLKCNPYLSVNKKQKETSSKCIHCGLCTFICPSYIDIEKFL